MKADLGPSLADFLAGLARRGIPLPFEIGTFLALETCEAIARGPASVSPAGVGVDEDGRITVLASGRASDEEACHSVVVLLGELLVRSAPGVPPALLALVEQGPGGGDWRLARLRDDLEAALVPLNRAATRRVLARLVRESRREDAAPAKRISSPPSAGEVDAEVDALFGVPTTSRAPASDADDAVVSEVVDPARPQVAGLSARRRSRPEFEAAADQAHGRSGRFGGAGLDAFERAAEEPGGKGGLIAVAAIGAALAAAAAVWFLR